VADFHDKLQSFATEWMVGDDLTAAWWAVNFSLTWNEAIETWSIASRMHLLDDPEMPDDALEHAARDRRMPRYFLETPEQHKSRIKDAWNAYALGGCREAIESQLALAGSAPESLVGTWGTADPDFSWGDETDLVWGDRGAVVIFNPHATGPRGETPPYYSQFWVRFAFGHHPVTGPPLPWDGTIWTWGDTDDGIWAPIGYVPNQAATWLGIILKWRANGWVFRGFIFDMGLDLEWGEASPDFDWGDSTDFVWAGALTVPMIT
jgi:hypothetical protein